MTGFRAFADYIEAGRAEPSGKSARYLRVTILRMVNKLFLTIAMAVTVFAATAAHAVTGDWVENDHGRVRLVSAVESTAPGMEIPLGLQFQMKPGWKIYWRSPGDAGFPPIPDWSASQNVADVRMDWPAPERFQVLGLETIGYKNEVVLPLTVVPADGAAATRLAGLVRYLTCDDICVPYDVSVSLTVPPGTGDPGPEAHLIDRFAARVPGPATAAGLEVIDATLQTADEGVLIQVAARAPDPFSTPDLYVEGPDGSYFDAPEVTLQPDGRTARFSVRGGGLEPAEFAAQPLTFTLVDGARAVEDRRQAPFAPEGGVTALGLWAALGLALIGGLILNLMPCVLPVLSLKLLSAVKYGGAEPARVRAGFLASAAGILTSFVILALILIALRAAGQSVGWGIQFQQPVFLAAMTAILVLFACNLAGLFEIHLPGFLGEAAVRGSDARGLAGHFLTGMFATLLATPCSAPFLGTAVGFALSGSAANTIMIFVALGLGLATPYLAVALAPRLATALPRPGPWMVKLKWVLAAALIATAVWLVSVLYVQAGGETAVAVAAFGCLIAAVLATRRLEGSRLGRHAGKIAAVLVISMAALPAVRGGPAAPPALLDDAVWQPFDEAAIPELVAADKIVFVDVTADWCITCQFNKRTVLNAGEIAAWLASGDVVAMKADWTSPDPGISRYLARFGRYGIPFNVIYGPSSPGGVTLPELLTREAVYDAARRAGGEGALASR